MASVFREVFSEQNVIVISLTNCLYQIFNGLWRMWWSLYLLELGAPILAVGLLATIQSASSIMFQLPGGVMADKIGRKRVIVAGTALRVLAPIIFLLAGTWEWTIPGIVINAAASFYMPAFNAIIAESLPMERRGAAFGAYRTLTSVPRIFMPIVSGVYIDFLGITEGVRMGLTLFVFAATVAMVTRSLLLKETLFTSRTFKMKKGEGPQHSGGALSTLLGLRGTILAMLVVACVSGFSLRMVYPYLVVYGVSVIGLTKTQWGILQTTAMAISTPLYFLGGMIADRFGRVPGIIVARSLLPFDSFGLLFLRDYNQLLLAYGLIGIGGGLGGGSIRGGGSMGGPSWQALVADIVPPRDRGKVVGLMATTTALLNLPASLIGAYLWEEHGPDILLSISAVVGLLVVPLILLYVKDPEERQE